MSVALIACGALAREVLALRDKYSWDAEVLGVAALLHNQPDRIPAAVRSAIRAARAKYSHVFVVYGDCGTGGIFPLATLDDEVELILSAGSGFGPAQERPVSQVERDLRLGLISREAAEATYDLSARKEKAA